MRVIGTAGHVDHGKSSLVEKLSGIHPDRLAEEQSRGLTIDLGFAWLELPNGDVLVLSRYFKLLGGFKARLERIPAGAIGGNAVLSGELLARFAPPLTVDNYEGVSVARDTDGTTLVYILSDDNFHFLQRTLLLLFHLDE